MSGFPALGPPAPSRLRGVLRSWLQALSNSPGQASDVLPNDTRVPSPHFYGPVRVLVVDDNPVNLMVISALMESRGLVPVLATDGAEAVALARERHFDLILMDLQMPILDGVRATSAIRRFEAESSRPAVPVVAYSSKSPGAAVLATHGMNASLIKPCEDQELEDCLVRWCPAYRPAPAAPAFAHDDSGWQAARRSPGSGRAAPR